MTIRSPATDYHATDGIPGAERADNAQIADGKVVFMLVESNDGAG